MAKVLVIICLLLVATLSKAAPILDEEVDNDFDENEENDDDVQDESEEKTNENDDDYDTTKMKDDDYVDNEEEGDLKGKEDEDEDEEVDNDNDDNEVEVVEERRGEKRAQYLEGDDDDDDDDDTGEEGEKSRDMTLDDRTVDAAARVVEDFEGKMALEKKSDRRDDEDDMDDEEETDGGDFKDMGQQISKLKKIFNEDMPREIKELKSNSKTLKDDLDNLNAKLENFLRDNGIKQDPALPQSNEEYDYDV